MSASAVPCILCEWPWGWLWLEYPTEDGGLIRKGPYCHECFDELRKRRSTTP